MDESIKLARQLGEIAADQKARAAVAGKGPRSEMHLADAKTCEDAAALLQKLHTEVYRLREGIGCHFYGRISGPELAKMARTWNGDTVTAGQRE
jgi:hypothetical protein